MGVSFGAVPGRGGGCGAWSCSRRPLGTGEGAEAGAEVGSGRVGSRDILRGEPRRHRGDWKRDARGGAAEPPQRPGQGRPLAVHRGIALVGSALLKYPAGRSEICCLSR